ncbi:ScbR family autoregulator-binding transcription factor [Luethyella okanaganae]|uniref:ScbR family autoregulator-binding transcription factor n=1 Tax=Luethyella okanaganae TaxID=69372 RepID=A0ABW1VF48_9MICO
MIQQDRARATRERVVVGAAEVFCRLGYASASLADITAAAGVTKGALYFHFQSKEEVARAIIEAEHRIATAAAIEIIASTGSALESMVSLCADLAKRLVTDPIVRACIRLTTEASIFEKPPIEPYRDWLLTFERLAAEAIVQGDIRLELDPATLARFVVPAFTGVQLVSDVFAHREDLSQRVQEMWMILNPAVVPPDRQERAAALIDEVFARE